MVRNNLGIIQTPDVDIEPYISNVFISYVGTPMEDVANAILKSVKSKKLLCVNLHNNTVKIFGIVPYMKYGTSCVFYVGAVFDSDNAECFRFSFDFLLQKFLIRRIEL